MIKFSKFLEENKPEHSHLYMHGMHPTDHYNYMQDVTNYKEPKHVEKFIRSDAYKAHVKKHAKAYKSTDPDDGHQSREAKEIPDVYAKWKKEHVK